MSHSLSLMPTPCYVSAVLSFCSYFTFSLLLATAASSPFLFRLFPVTLPFPPRSRSRSCPPSEFSRFITAWFVFRFFFYALTLAGTRGSDGTPTGFPKITCEHIGRSSRNLIYKTFEQFYIFPENFKTVPTLTFDM